MSYSASDFVADITERALTLRTPGVTLDMAENEDLLRDLAEAIATALSTIPKPTEREKPRWRCPCCKSFNVQISLPTWYYETKNYDLIGVDVDSEADVKYWYCEDCDETGSGSPEEVP